MTYAGFLLLFLILPSCMLAMGILYFLKHKGATRPGLSNHAWGTAILALIAFVWTTPWDNYLIASGVWNSPEGKILGRIAYVPLEEYAFFILMPLFNALFLYPLLLKCKALGAPEDLPVSRLRTAFIFIGLLLLLLGLVASCFDSGRYLGLILLWFTPPLLVQWLYDPAALIRYRTALLIGTLCPTLYFAGADSWAIHLGIWHISPELTTGWAVGNLPVEEILFFFTTSLLIAQGLILWHRLNKQL